MKETKVITNLKAENIDQFIQKRLNPMLNLLLEGNDEGNRKVKMRRKDEQFSRRTL